MPRLNSLMFLGFNTLFMKASMKFFRLTVSRHSKCASRMESESLMPSCFTVLARARRSPNRRISIQLRVSMASVQASLNNVFRLFRVERKYADKDKCWHSDSGKAR